MYIETWLFWLVVIGVVIIFGSVISSLSAKINLIEKIYNNDFKELQAKVKSLENKIK